MSAVSPSEAVDASQFAERLMADPALLSSLDASVSDAFVIQVVDWLKSEADRHWAIDPNRSVEIADLIIAIGTHRGQLSTIALGTMARGDALKLIGRTTEAWDTLGRAGQLYQQANDEVGWARTRIGRLALGTMLNCLPEVLSDADQARAIFNAHDDQERLLRLDWVGGSVYNNLGEPRKALEHFNSAIAAAEALGEAGQAYYGRLYANMATSYEDLGELGLASDYYDRARQIFLAGGELVNLTIVDSNSANIALVQGHYRQALRLLTTSLDRLGNQPLLATKTKWHILECYLALNRYVDAHELAHEVVAEYRRFSDDYELARALMQVATVEAELGNLTAARAALDEADVIFAELGSATWSAMAALWRGRLELRLREPARALAAARMASAYFEEHGQRANEAAAVLLMGEAALAAGDVSAATAMGLRALNAAHRYSVPALRYSSHLLLGQAAEVLSARQRAKRHYRAAAATVERVQRGLTITLRPGFLEDKGEALRRLITLTLQDNQPRQALEVLEVAKSQVHLAYVVNRENLRWDKTDSQSRGLIDELEKLKSEHQWLYRLAHEVGGETDRRSPLEPDEAWSRLPAQERRMRAITEQLYYQTRNGETILPTPAMSLDDTQQALDDETLLVEYYDDGTHLWAFCLSRHTLTMQPLQATMTSVSEVYSRLQLNISAALASGAQAAAILPLAGHAKRLLHRLHSDLIAPLALEPGKWRRLVIVPYGALHYLPFGLLFDGQRHLIELHEIVNLPAAGLAARPGPSQKPGALVLAYSGNGRLPYTQAEANMIRRVLGGSIYVKDEASRAVLRAAPTQVLHIAAHGHFRADQPDLSYLELADGQVYTDDLVQQDLSYELVTLSACETGRAQSTGGELIGLGRGFLYAGAGALVMSLWPVVDATTLQVMESMYAALKAGQSKAAALRSAQLTQLSEDAHAHPAFWGTFQLIGDARPLTPPAASAADKRN